MIALKIDLRGDCPDGGMCVCVALFLLRVYFADCESCGACEWLHWRSIWEKIDLTVWHCCYSFLVGRWCFHPWIMGIRNLCKLFIHFKYCRKLSSFTSSRHLQTSDGGMCVCVCVALFLFFLCILQAASRVAHVNDCVEDRSERRLTWRCGIVDVLFL